MLQGGIMTLLEETMILEMIESAAEDDPESLQGAHPIETGQLRHPKGGQ